MPQGSNEGANSPLSPVSGAPTELPTDCERDDASREGDLAEEPTLVPELHATVPDSLLASRFPPPTCLLALPVPGGPLLRSSKCASYWRTRIAACGLRLTYHLLGPGFPLDMLLYADDLESMGRGAKGRRGIPLSYLYLAALGYPFKWAKTR